MPDISREDAFDLWHVAGNLVAGIDNLRLIVPRVKTFEAKKLVTALSRHLGLDSITSDLAGEVVRKASRAPLATRRARATKQEEHIHA